MKKKIMKGKKSGSTWTVLPRSACMPESRVHLLVILIFCILLVILISISYISNLKFNTREFLEKVQHFDDKI